MHDYCIFDELPWSKSSTCKFKIIALLLQKIWALNALISNASVACQSSANNVAMFEMKLFASSPHKAQCAWVTQWYLLDCSCFFKFIYFPENLVVVLYLKWKWAIYLNLQPAATPSNGPFHQVQVSNFSFFEYFAMISPIELNIDPLKFDYF